MGVSLPVHGDKIVSEPASRIKKRAIPASDAASADPPNQSMTTVCSIIHLYSSRVKSGAGSGATRSMGRPPDPTEPPVYSMFAHSRQLPVSVFGLTVQNNQAHFNPGED
jgi:hypothetical protein